MIRLEEPGSGARSRWRNLSASWEAERAPRILGALLLLGLGLGLMMIGCSQQDVLTEAQHDEQRRAQGAAQPASASALETSAGAGARIEHVLLISIDTLRADHLGTYGHPFVRSPHIDGLAADGLRFDNHISAAPTTLASHTSLMTGMHPHSHGAARNSFIVPEQNAMLAEILGEAGFVTAAFLGAAALHSSVRFTQGFDFVDEEFEIFAKHTVNEKTDRVHHGQRRAEQVTDAVLRWLEDAPTGRKFLFVHYFDVHWAYKPPPPYDQMYRDDDLPISGSLADIKRVRKELAAGAPDAERHARVLDQLYAGEITYTDFHIGRLLEGLRIHQMFDDTLVLVTSDHGETMWEHKDRFNHGIGLFDTTVLTPLIVRFPDRLQAGLGVEAAVSNVDVAPSILEWLGLEAPAAMEGRSFASVAQGGSLQNRPPVFSEATHPFREPYESHPDWLNQNKRQSARTERHKLIYQPNTESFQFYDLEDDPGEQQSLGIESAEAQRLKAELLRFRDRAAPPLSCTVEDAEMLSQLQALGYMAASEPPKCNQKTDN